MVIGLKNMDYMVKSQLVDKSMMMVQPLKMGKLLMQ